MRARSDVLWLIGILSLLAITVQVLHIRRAAAETAAACVVPPPPRAATLPPSLFSRALSDEATMWIPLSNVSSQTASAMVTARFSDARIRCYGPHLVRVQAEPATVHRISTFCRRLDQPTDLSAWYPPQE